MKSFLALLVFLYTDTVPTDMTVSDYRDLLVLADRFCLPRLISVCEGAIVDRISAEIKKKRLNSAQCNDVINLLLTGQVGAVVSCGSQVFNTVRKESKEILLEELYKDALIALQRRATKEANNRRIF